MLELELHAAPDPVHKWVGRVGIPSGSELRLDIRVRAHIRGFNHILALVSHCHDHTNQKAAEQNGAKGNPETKEEVEPRVADHHKH